MSFSIGTVLLVLQKNWQTTSQYNENERKKQQKLKARFDEAEKRAWQTERKLEEATAAKVELEMNGRLKTCLRATETGMSFSVSTQGSKS